MKRILVANRGAVAARVIRALKKLGMESVAVYSDADAELPYLAQADHAVHIGGPNPVHSYLNQDAILRAALDYHCAGVHPGYGFLSENAQFASRVQEAGLVFVGPSPKWIALLGDKIRARRHLQQFGMPMLKSSEELHTEQDLTAAIGQIGLPALLKPSGGGGGIGMLPIHSPDEISTMWGRAKNISEKAFSSGSLYIEKLATHPRHIEFQFLADRYGNVQCLFERDCSVQRRRQKVIEEAPACNLERQQLTEITSRLEKIMADIGYDIIGTVEMLYDQENGFTFLEINTRLQVEHAVTEEVTGIDIVASQIQLAFGARLDSLLPNTVQPNGHAIEARIYAEDPIRFFPSCGTLLEFDFPLEPGIRLETGYQSGNQITPYYDPLLAKLIASGPSREICIQRLTHALTTARVAGVKTNIPFVLRTLDTPDFQNATYSTDTH